MNILVTGGAGYIGSHVIKDLLLDNHQVTVIDDKESKKIFFKEKKVNYLKVNLLEKKKLKEIFHNLQIDAVMHFAAVIDVNESIIDPSLYYRNNVIGSLNILDLMVEYNTKHFIFSSTAAVYGNTKQDVISEDHIKNPISPYGNSKSIVEEILSHYQKAFNIRFSILRYFNACGAHTDGTIGECHDPETHLIPLILQVASGRRRSLEVFGNNFNTIDGTCVRDYIHVMDVSSAHVMALENLLNKKKSSTFNIGSGKGYSVSRIIKEVEKCTSMKIPFSVKERRKGDPDSLIADIKKIKDSLGWVPKYSNLQNIISTAWKWEQTLKKKLH